MHLRLVGPNNTYECKSYTIGEWIRDQPILVMGVGNMEKSYQENNKEQKILRGQAKSDFNC